MAALPEPTIPRSRPRYVAPVLPHLAATYSRVSTKRQADDPNKTSLETQEANCRGLAATDGVPVSDELAIIDKHSGEELHERPGLTRLRDAAKRREFSTLYVNSTDRLSRDPIHLGIVLEEMERAGVTVKFVTEPMDDSPEGQIVRFVRGISSKIDNARRREASMRGVRARVEHGRFLPGPRPTYGYAFGPERDKEGKLTKDRLVPDPVTAPIVQRIYRDAAAGRTERSIAARLTAEGVPTPTGKQRRWNPASVRYLLANPTYRGQATALLRKEIPVEKRVRAFYAKKTRTIARPKDETVPLPERAAPALVSAEMAAQVDARRKLNQQQAARNNLHPEETLLRAGIARCGYCGGALRVKRKGPNPSHGDLRQRTIYMCNKASKIRGDCSRHGISPEHLDGAVWAKVSEVLCDPSIIEQEVARMRETSENGRAPGADVLEVIDKQIAEVARRIKNKRDYAELVDDARERAEVAEEVKLLWEQRRALEAERQASEAHYASWREQQEGLEHIIDWCERVAGNLDAMTYEQRRGVLLALKAEVKLYYMDRTPRAELIITLPLSGAIPLSLDTLDSGYCGEKVNGTPRAPGMAQGRTAVRPRWNEANGSQRERRGTEPPAGRAAEMRWQRRSAARHRPRRRRQPAPRAGRRAGRGGARTEYARGAQPASRAWDE